MLLEDEGHHVMGGLSRFRCSGGRAGFSSRRGASRRRNADKSGYEVAREIRSRYADPAPILIAISGRYKQGSDKVLAEIVGFDYHLSKPYEAKTLLALLAPPG
jgi:hypothetical protein